MHEQKVRMRASVGNHGLRCTKLSSRRGLIFRPSVLQSTCASATPTSGTSTDVHITSEKAISTGSMSASQSRSSSLNQPILAQVNLGRRDPVRLVAMFATLGLTGEAAYSWLSTQPSLPSIDDVAGVLAIAAAWLLGAVPAGLALTKLAMRDYFHVEVHRGRLYICVGVPSQGPRMEPGSVAVRPTGDVRGNGAFATSFIPAGIHIGDYSGDLLDRAAFAARYPDRVGDYAMALDDEWVIDGASFAPQTTTFHPVHMNHSRHRANVRRFYRRAEGRVSFFTIRDIHPGQELLYDYGRAYWFGREQLELP